MAPGRIDFGVGTGFSARRAMGLGAMKLADMEEYIRVVYGLLNGETLETTIEGKRRKIRFLNPDAGLINIKRSGQAARLRLWPEIAGAGGEAGRRRGRPSSATCRARCRRSRAMRKDWAAAGRSSRRPLRHRLGLRLRAGTGRAGRQPARDGAGRTARGGVAAPRRRRRHGGLEEHLRGSRSGATRTSTATSRSRANSNRPTRAT